MNKFLFELVASTFFLYVILATNNAIAIGAALAITIILGGGDVNPAATIMRVMAGTVSLKDAIPNILVQIAGGLVALELHKRVRL